MANFDLSNSRRSTAAGAEKLALYSGRGHQREILARQGRQAEVRPPRLHRKPLRGIVQADGTSAHRAVCARCRSAYWPKRGGAGPFDLRLRAVDDLGIQIGGAEADAIGRRDLDVGRIGMVLRRSTTDWACEMAFTRAARSIEISWSSLSRSGPGQPRANLAKPAQMESDQDSGLQAAQQVDILSQAVFGVAQLFRSSDAMHDGGDRGRRSGARSRQRERGSSAARYIAIWRGRATVRALQGRS